MREENRWLIKVPRLLRKRFHSRILSYVPRKFPVCNQPLTIMIPLATKDIAKAAMAVTALRRHILHPISEIVIAGQDNDTIRGFCADVEARYVNEVDVLPRTISSATGGWIRQQYLKLSVFHFVDAANVLIYDADTFLMRDLSFFDGDKQILLLADEYTKSYEATLRLLGPIKRHPRSFVAHFMLLQRDLMAALEEHVTRLNACTFDEAILATIKRGSAAGLSEFELYGNFLCNFHPARFFTRYWYNWKISPDTTMTLDELHRKYWQMNSVSSHLHG